MDTRATRQNKPGWSRWAAALAALGLAGGLACGGERSATVPPGAPGAGTPATLVTSPAQGNVVVGSSSGGGYVLRSRSTSASVVGAPRGAGLELTTPKGGAP